MSIMMAVLTERYCLKCTRKKAVLLIEKRLFLLWAQLGVSRTIFYLIYV